MSAAIDFLRHCKEHPRAHTRRMGMDLGWSSTRVLGWQSFLINKDLIRVRGAGHKRHVTLTPEGLDVLNGRAPAPTKKTTSKPKPRASQCDAKQRNCLMCRNEFMSTWAGERVCKSCRSSSTWQSGGAFEAPEMGRRIPHGRGG